MSLVFFDLLGQTSIRLGGGVSDIGFREGGQSAYLGYEVNSLTHKIPLFTYQVGVAKDWSLSNRFALLTELLWSRKGLSYSTDYLYGDFKYKLILHYLELPILLKVKTNIKNQKSSGFFLGPYLGVLLNDRLDRNESGRYRVGYGEVNRLDPGVLLGYQADFNVRELRFYWDLRSGYSLSNMMQFVDDVILSTDHPDEAYARNITVILSLGYVLKSSLKREEL